MPNRLRDAIVDAARAAVGTRFRPQGRTPGLALDCVGVALLAAAAAGLKPERIPAYAINGDHAGRIETLLRDIGCMEVADAEPGDLLLIAPTERQRHLAVLTPVGIVHAHAGIGRVVEGPFDTTWTVLSAWRLPGVR